MLYRALSGPCEYEGRNIELSTIGYADSKDGKNFNKRRQFISPSEEWEKFGCEDPRVTYFEGEYFIFYTALGTYPPDAGSIKAALALSDDLKKIKQKHLVTLFNAKAMMLFPQRIKGRLAALLTVNTDRPPAKIAIAYFDKKEDIWSLDFWREWYKNLDKQIIGVERLNTDLTEAGAVPILTDEGWLFVYSHIHNYYDEKKRLFAVEALLLDRDNPQKIIGRTDSPLLVPEENYEKVGMIKNVVFPTSALLEDKNLLIYYGAADTCCALASEELASTLYHLLSSSVKKVVKLDKFSGNPILQPSSEKPWQAMAVFNPAAIYLENKFFLLYRAMSNDNTSTLGVLVSEDGLNFKQYFNDPVYVPRMPFEQKKKLNGLSGCEDPRLTLLGDRLYMLYTAFDSIHPPRVALTSIDVGDFLYRRWLWAPPVLISPDNVDDKNACIFPEKIKGKYIIFHRVNGREIAVDFAKTLNFNQDNLLKKEGAILPRPGMWDSAKIGIAGPPIKTPRGWFLLYHGVSELDGQYRLGFMLLDLKNPLKILFRTMYPVLEPTEHFEKEGIVPNVVFSCGAVVVNGVLYVYYGGGDRVICAATAGFAELLTYAS